MIRNTGRSNIKDLVKMVFFKKNEEKMIEDYKKFLDDLLEDKDQALKVSFEDNIITYQYGLLDDDVKICSEETEVGPCFYVNTKEGSVSALSSTEDYVFLMNAKFERSKNILVPVCENVSHDAFECYERAHPTKWMKMPDSYLLLDEQISLFNPEIYIKFRKFYNSEIRG